MRWKVNYLWIPIIVFWKIEKFEILRFALSWSLKYESWINVKLTSNCRVSLSRKISNMASEWQKIHIVRFELPRCELSKRRCHVPNTAKIRSIAFSIIDSSLIFLSWFLRKILIFWIYLNDPPFCFRIAAIPPSLSRSKAYIMRRPFGNSLVYNTCVQ